MVGPHHHAERGNSIFGVMAEAGRGHRSHGSKRQSIMHSNALRRFFTILIDATVRLSRTRANYWLESVLDTTLGVALLGVGLRRQVFSPDEVLFIALGLLLFSFIEYCFHRWLFHGHLRLLAQGHNAHHTDPLGYDALPFFVPALVLAALIAVAVLAMPVAAVLLVASGITFGYVAYGLSHYMIHHRRFRHPLMRKWAAYHHIHHYHPQRNFGVTSPLWDVLLGTRYISRQDIAGPRSTLPS